MSKSDAVGELFLCNAWCFLAHQRECLEQLLQQLGANADEDLVQAIVGCNQAVVWCLDDNFEGEEQGLLIWPTQEGPVSRAQFRAYVRKFELEFLSDHGDGRDDHGWHHPGRHRCGGNS